MPLFDFRCLHCGTVMVDCKVGINEDWKKLRRCKHCFGKLEKIPGISNPVFIGDGWTEKAGKTEKDND